MSAGTTIRPVQDAARRGAPEVRLSVEQASYAYAAEESDAPLFTLEATSFQVRPRSEERRVGKECRL